MSSRSARPTRLVSRRAVLAAAASGLAASTIRGVRGVFGQPDATGRATLLAAEGLVVASQPSAAQIGLDTLQAGGTATDAALAAAAAVIVLEPQTAGLGGDLAGLVFDVTSGETYGLRSIGPSRGAAHTPGCVDGLVALHGRFARKPLSDLLAPAIELAENGRPTGERTSLAWQRAAGRLHIDDTLVHPLLPGGGPPELGRRVPRPDLAATLRLIALRGRGPIYDGAIAGSLLTALNESIAPAATSEKTPTNAASPEAAPTPLTPSDLARQNAEWLSPARIAYRGRTIVALPDAAATLQALSLLVPYDVRAIPQRSAALVHLLTEAWKIAASDGRPLTERLDPGDVATTRRRLDPNVAAVQLVPPAAGESSTTVTAIDRDGNQCVLTLTMGDPFGTGRLLPSTGLLLGTDPAERLPQPLMVLQDDAPIAALGVCGPGHPTLLATEAVTGLLDFGRLPQQAVDQPRFDVAATPSGAAAHRPVLALEPRWPPETRAALARRGHALATTDTLGRLSLATRRAIENVLLGGAESRDDSRVVGY